MKFWAILFSVLIMFGGCASASKKYSTPKKHKLQKGRNLGNGIYHFNSKGMVWAVKTKYDYSSEPYDLKRMLLGANFIHKFDKKYKLNKMINLEPIDKKLILYDFAYNKKKNEYTFSGEYLDTTGRSIRFIVKYDTTSLDVKGIYYTSEGKNSKVYMSNDGEYAIFDRGAHNTILDMKNQKSIRFNMPKDMYSFFIKQPLFSKNKKYVAIFLNPRKKADYDSEVIIVDTKTGDIKRKFRFHNKTAVDTTLYDYSFSDDEKLFFYKGYGKKFTVYDIENGKVVKSFGVTNDSSMKWETSSTNADENYFIGIYFGKYKDSSKGRKDIIYLYNISSNSLICKVENEYSFRTFIDKKTNTLHITTAGGRTKIYSIEKDNCKKIGTVYEDKGETDAHSMLSTSDGDIRYWFHNGEVKSFIYKKPSFSKKDIEVVEKIEKLKRLFEVGFIKKGMKELKNLILNDPYDYFGLQYTKIIKFLTDSQEVYLNVLGYQRYMKRDINIDYYHFHRAIRNYIFIASNRGFKEMIPPMIDVYKKVIGNKPTKKHSDILAVYKANYLLDIGKDDEAYELLFDISPIYKDAKEMISLFSDWNIGLMKNRKKLSVATGIKESDLNKPTKSKPLDYFYDLAGNIVKKDISSVKTEKHTQKQNAIKLLD